MGKTFWNSILSWIQWPWLEREEKKSFKLSLKYDLVYFYDEWTASKKSKRQKLKGTPKVTEMLQRWCKACLSSGFIFCPKRSSILALFLFQQQDEEMEQFCSPSTGSRPSLNLEPASMSGNKEWTGLKRKCMSETPGFEWFNSWPLRV